MWQQIGQSVVCLAGKGVLRFAIGPDGSVDLQLCAGGCTWESSQAHEKVLHQVRTKTRGSSDLGACAGGGGEATNALDRVSSCSLG